MGLYCKFEQVRLRLIGKIRFTDQEGDENKMFIPLANKLINEAEGQVELDLSPRYLAPFQTIDGQPYTKLPIRPTQNVITTLAELQSVIRMLETDFGAGTPVDGENYAKKLRERYNQMIHGDPEKGLTGLIGFKDDSYLTWAQPPLPGLRLNWGNAAADDGFHGTAYNQTEGIGGYAAEHINLPSANWWNITWPDEEAT